MIATTLVLVKHALPVLDPAKPANEWVLGAEGERQAKPLSEHLRAFAPLRLVASREPKASRTAQLVAAELGVRTSTVEGLQEFDRPRLPLLSKAEHERTNAQIFVDPDRRVLGSESARDAINRFSAAIDAELERTLAQSLVAVTHGTVIALFVGAHNRIDAFALWKKLVCPAYVVLNLPAFSLREVVADAGAPP